VVSPLLFSSFSFSFFCAALQQSLCCQPQERKAKRKYTTKKENVKQLAKDLQDFFLLVAEHLDIARRYPGHGSSSLRIANFDFDFKADMRCKIKDMHQVQEKQRTSPDS
jgi:hypothetical protein